MPVSPQLAPGAALWTKDAHREVPNALLVASPHRMRGKPANEPFTLSKNVEPDRIGTPSR